MDRSDPRSSWFCPVLERPGYRNSPLKSSCWMALWQLVIIWSQTCGFSNLTAPIIHLHNGCLFIHYANGMRGKLGNKGRRREKIALGCFNILFISKHCGLQKAEPQGTSEPGNLFSPFCYELPWGKKKRYIFFCMFMTSFGMPHCVEGKRQNRPNIPFFEIGLEFFGAGFW